MSATTTIAPSVKIDGLYGDVNGDGFVDVADAVKLLQFIANSNKYPLDAAAIERADVDGQPGITGTDVLTIQKVDARMIAQGSLPL